MNTKRQQLLEDVSQALILAAAVFWMSWMIQSALR